LEQAREFSYRCRPILPIQIAKHKRVPVRRGNRDGRWTLADTETLRRAAARPDEVRRLKNRLEK
jgi:hypothetical protein